MLWYPGPHLVPVSQAAQLVAVFQVYSFPPVVRDRLQFCLGLWPFDAWFYQNLHFIQSIEKDLEENATMSWPKKDKDIGKQTLGANSLP